MDYEDNIRDFISAMGEQDYVNSSNMFSELIAAKLNDAIEAKKIEVASAVFGQEEVSDEEFEDFEEELEEE